MDQGSVLVFLNGPNDRLEFSMDGVFGRTFKKFEGFHSVPIEKGVHFISYRIINSGSEGAFITLVFYPIKPKVFLFEWCKDTEIFKLKGETDKIVLDKLLEYPGLISYERFMNHEPDALSRWKRFTKFITNESISTVFSASKITENLFEVTPMMESHHSLLKELETRKDSIGPLLEFTRIPSLKDYGRLTEADSVQITQCAMDQSAIFRYLNCSLYDLFSQLQLSFLLLSFAQNFEGFEQWFDIVRLLLESFDLASKHLKDYKEFFQIIQEHFEMCSDDFFTGLMNENKLYKLLNTFFVNSNGNFEEFKQFYEIKFGWNFEGDEDECNDDAPVIVIQ